MRLFKNNRLVLFWALLLITDYLKQRSYSQHNIWHRSPCVLQHVKWGTTGPSYAYNMEILLLAPWEAKSLGGSPGPRRPWMMKPEMVEEKGCPTRRWQAQDITKTIGTKIGKTITTGLIITIVSHYCATMHNGHVCCLHPRKNATDRQTDMVRPIRCSSLTLERKEHLKINRLFWKGKVKKKGKVIPLNAMAAHVVRGGMAPTHSQLRH
jgi:hypothetical protein